jgi:hypothetical protein
VLNGTATTTDIPEFAVATLTELHQVRPSLLQKIPFDAMITALSNIESNPPPPLLIEKIPGKPLIEKLRVIHIYEADWNLILKYFVAHKLTKSACHQNSVTMEQVGATKTGTTPEIYHLQKLTGAMVYNDVKACLDRIIENMSNLACMREGLAPSYAKQHSQTLRQMQNHIKAHHDCSQHHNGNMKPVSFLVSTQGAGVSMARCGLESDAPIRAYNKTAISEPIVALLSKVRNRKNTSLCG